MRGGGLQERQLVGSNSLASLSPSAFMSSECDRVFGASTPSLVTAGKVYSRRVQGTPRWSALY
jgi:hypothetical protein